MISVSVKAVHGLPDAIFDDGGSRLDSPLQDGGELLLLLGREARQHPVRQIVIRVGLLPHADTDAGEILRAQFGDQRLGAVVAAGRAVGPDAELAHRQGHKITRICSGGIL